MDERKLEPDRSDRGSSLIAAAIVAAALILSWGMSNSQPRYELTASGAAVVRMDTDSGALIACNAQRCTQVQPPDRAKTLGPLSLQIGGAKEQTELPAPKPPTTNQSR